MTSTASRRGRTHLAYAAGCGCGGATIHVMSDPTTDAGPPFGSWPGGITGMDSEWILRAGSVMELGTGLHHLAVMADRYVADHDKLPAADIADTSFSARAVAPDLRERLTRKLGEFTDTYKDRIQAELDQLDADSLPEQVTDPFQWMATQLSGPMRDSPDDARAVLAEMPVDNVALMTYLMQYGQALDRRPLLPKMRRALLITSVASAETMLVGVLRRLQYDRGGAARWGPMWDSPELDKEVRRLTRGSIDDWVPRVLTDLGVDLPAASCDWDAVREIWARRHVLVHNAGLADKKYVDRITGAIEGTMLEADGEYVRNAIDLLCGLLLGVILRTWTALPGRSTFAVQFADVYAVTADSEHRWPLAENLHMLAAQLESDHEHAATNQVNAWLARTHWRGPDSVLADAAQWATDDLPRRFSLARTVLLGQRDAAIAMLPQLLGTGEITTNNLREWPLFASLRDIPAFERLVTD
jgi:hypothetical protein